MGNLYYRFRVGLLAVVFVGLSSFVQAETMPAGVGQTEPVVTGWKPSGFNQVYGSVDAACAASVQVYGTQAISTGPVKVTKIRYSCPSNMGNQTPDVYAQYPYCPVNTVYNQTTQYCEGGVGCPLNQGWTLQGDTCTRPDCESGYDRNSSGQCVKDCTAKQGMALPNTHYETDTNGNGQFGDCRIHCTTMNSYGFSVSGSGTNPPPVTQNDMYHTSTGCSYTGASAQPGDFASNGTGENPNKNDPKTPKDCLGSGMGYITSSSGKATCVAQQDAPDGQKPTTSKNEESKESGKSGADGKPDPSSPDYEKQEKSTSTSGGKTTEETKTTKNPGTDSDGNPTCETGFTLTEGKCVKTTSKTQDTASYCKENPKDPACEGTDKATKSTFGGSCSEGFTCDGDAATCASAKAAKELRCAFEADSTTNLHDAENPGGTPGQIDAAAAALNSSGSADINIADKFAQNQQAWVNFSSGCPVGVQTFTIAGKQLELDGSIVCDIGLFIRMMVHIAAYMGLARVFATKLV